MQQTARDERTGPLEDEAAAFGSPDLPIRLPRWLAATWPYALVLLIGLFILLPRLGQYGFWDPWEAKYAESVREMIERDSYVVPYYRDEVRLTKPILVYWGALVGAAVFGLNEFGARIVGVLMALASMLTVFYGVSVLRGRTAGLLSAMLLGTFPLFYFLARQVTPDVYLMTSLGCALLLFAVGLFGPDRRRDLHFGLSYACFALAVLAKGPIVAGAIFAGSLAIYTLGRVDVRRLLQPDLRPGTLRVLFVGLPGLLLFGIFSALAFLFGTSPLWWGYSTSSRRDMATVRQELLAMLNRLHATEILLVALALVSAWFLVRMLRRGLPETRLSTAGAAALGFTALAAAVALIFAGGAFKILAAAILGMVGAGMLVGRVTWDWLRQPALWAVVQPLLRPVGRQLLLFAGVFAVVAGPWHIAIFIKQDHGYFTDFIIKHNIQRYGKEINSSGTADFYLRTLVFGLFPWSCLLPAALASAVAWRERNPLQRYALECYMLIAAVVTFGAFGSSVTKFSYYLSPILIPLAVLLGVSLARLLEDRDRRPFRLAAVTGAVLLLAPLSDLLQDGGIKYLLGSFSVKRFVPRGLQPDLEYHWMLFAFMGLLLVSAIIRSRIVIGALFLMAVMTAHFSATAFVPSISPHKTMKHLVETWKAEAPASPLGFFGALKHGMFFYSANQVETLGDDAEFFEFMAPGNTPYAVVERKHFLRLRPRYAKTYPGYELKAVDETHFSYSLVKPVRAAR